MNHISIIHTKKIICIGFVLFSCFGSFAQKTNFNASSNNTPSEKKWHTEFNAFLGVSFTDIFRKESYTPANAMQFDTARRASNSSAHAGYTSEYKVTPQLGLMATTNLNSFLSFDWGIKYRRFILENTTDFDSVAKYKDYLPIDNRTTYIKYGFQNINLELALRLYYKSFSCYVGASTALSSKTDGTKHLYPSNEVRSVTSGWKTFDSEGRLMPRPYFGLQYRFFSTDEYRFYVYLSSEWVTQKDYQTSLGLKWCFGHTGDKTNSKKNNKLSPPKRMDD